ncbi:MAG: type II toxin-antitoxin system HicA family toxin [Candidatus Wallbacteria bacterium]|nr:type II toxin-antitoxin system HicA family toxin [Candidatus Wallbacteria bacterium]
MPKQVSLTAAQAESILLKAGFVLIRTKGSHRIYQKGKERFVIPFHGKKSLHPKIVTQLLEITTD